MGCCMDSNNNDYKYSTQQQQQFMYQGQLSEKDLTIAKLKNLRDDLFAKQQALYYQEQKSDQEIRFFLANQKKQRAKFALQRKKLYDNYLAQIEQKYNFIQQQIIQVESMIFDQRLNEIMESTNKFLKDIQTTINMDTFSDAVQVNKNLEEQEELFEDLFEKYNVGDVDKEYAKYEAEIFHNSIHQQLPQQSQIRFSQQQMQPIQQYPAQYVILN